MSDQIVHRPTLTMTTSQVFALHIQPCPSQGVFFAVHTVTAAAE